jgi:hypothetical protein
MNAKHILGIGLLVVGVVVGHELFSEKRNQQLIDNTTDAVAFEFEYERDRNEVRRDREHVNRLAETRDVVTDGFNREREDRAARDARNQAVLIESTRQAVADQFQKERDANATRADETRTKYQAIAMVSEGFVMSSNVRMMVAQHYMQNGDMPDSNHDVGLPRGHKFKRNAVESVEVGYDGVITITYNQLSGVKGAKIKLRPNVNPALGFHWDCETRSFESIAAWMPQCRYVG